MLDKKLSLVLGTTKNHLTRLDYLGLATVRDFLLYFPRTYEDQRRLKKIMELKTEEVNTAQGVISNIVNKSSRFGKFLTHALLTDDTGSVEVVWFNQPFISRLIKAGDTVILSGRLKYAFGRITLQNPKYELKKKEQIHTARLVPVYHETEGVTSKWFREKLHNVLPFSEYFKEYLPAEIIARQQLMPYVESIRQVHFPSNEKILETAKERLAFDELFMIQFMALQKKWYWQCGVAKGISRIKTERGLLEKFLKELPFKLTNAQIRVIDEILADLEKDYPMLRLIQGDVGSGKTIVAATIALNVIKAGYQTAIMAPTEILAKQHFETMLKFLKNYDLNIQLLTGSLTAKQKEKIVNELKSGEINLVIGTHALIQEKVNFKSLKLAIVDEQHRFGVAQRDKLKSYGNPHLLNLSATPIPRTLALTIYGDQDLSIIDELPQGRQTIITRVVPEDKRNDAYNWIREQVKTGRQVFVICPLIDESDMLEVKSVLTEYERLSKFIFSDLKVNFLHVKLKQEEKDEIMSKFSKGETNILVSTSVVEVGIDVPNATIMVIEGAERFGLSQLHQFRGRVGRGEYQSYCFLFPTLDTEEVRKRLSAMVKYSSGFKLAEIDLQLRGPGEIYGVKQSGIPDLKMASFSDSKLIARARAEAEKMVSLDPELLNHPLLKEKIEELKKEKE